MELLTSLRLFLWGVIKRFYYWMPFILLDTFDLWERYLKPFFNGRFGGDVELPPETIVIITAFGLAWAAFLTYHDLRKQHSALETQLYDKARRRAVREALGEFMEEGNQLRAQCTHENEPPPNEKTDDWAARAEACLREHLGDSYVFRFRSSAGLPIAGTSISSQLHRELWSGIHIRVARLDQFIAELKD